MKKSLIIAILCTLIGALVSYICVSAYFRAKIRALEPKVVEVIKWDTLRLENPLEISLEITDTMLLAVRDTIRIADTLYIQLPREEKVYEDSTYRAVVSGYDPCLESIWIRERTIEKTTTLYDTRRWRFAVQGGVGLVLPFNSTPALGGYVGIGVGYNF